MSSIIGIDLGTTNSCVAVLEGDKPVIIANAEGRLVGDLAKRQAVTNAEGTVSSIKREMGTDSRLELGGRRRTPQEISAMILQKLKADAEEYLGHPVTDAVITVPAYFNDVQRQATKDAGRIAGLNVRRIINEPTAAALAYGLDHGTFDVSIIEIGEGVIEVLSTCGDNHLGGDDFDQRLTNYLVSEFKQQTKYNAAKDPAALQRIREAAEKAKKELSAATSTVVNLPFLAQTRSGPLHMEITVTRTQFERLTRDLVERTTMPVQTALNDAGISVSQLGRVLLVGGSTRIPAVQEHVRSLVGMMPSKGLNPDECVALGAAVQGGTLGGAMTTTGTGKEILLLDVTPLSLSIETVGGVATRLISRNSTLPVRYSQIFTTAANFQSNVEIHVLQGERSMARDNKTIGKFKLTGIKRAPRGIPQIEVTFDLDANGILKVSARDLATGRAQEIVISSNSNLSEEEIREAIRDAEAYAQTDGLRREAMEARNEAEGLAIQVKEALRVCGKDLNRQDRNRIKADLAELERLLHKYRPEKLEPEAAPELSSAAERVKAGAAVLMPLYENARQEREQ